MAFFRKSPEIFGLDIGSSGVKAVLNFSPGSLKVPPGVKLKNVDLTVSLESLSFFLARAESEVPVVPE